MTWHETGTSRPLALVDNWVPECFASLLASPALVGRHQRRCVDVCGSEAPTKRPWKTGGRIGLCLFPPVSVVDEHGSDERSTGRTSSWRESTELHPFWTYLATLLLLLFTLHSAKGCARPPRGVKEAALPDGFRPNEMGSWAAQPHRCTHARHAHDPSLGGREWWLGDGTRCADADALGLGPWVSLALPGLVGSVPQPAGLPCHLPDQMVGSMFLFVSGRYGGRGAHEGSRVGFAGSLSGPKLLSMGSNSGLASAYIEFYPSFACLLKLMLRRFGKKMRYNKFKGCLVCRD